MSSSDNTSSAGDKVRAKADEAKAKAEETKQTILEKLKEDGVVNPQGLTMSAFTLAFLAAIPVTSWIAQPSGLLEKAINAITSTVTYVSSAGSTSTISPTGRIASLSALYIFTTHAFSGAMSAAGVAAGNSDGRDNCHPRSQVKNLSGLPLRLHSAHYNLMEMFPGFALAAALTQATVPTDGVLVNLLGLHVLSKVFV
jgi:uncharacterized MAPEG superfamily protein